MYRKSYLIVSILSLLNVLFVPVFDVWGGLIPSQPEESFFDAVELIFTESDAFQYWIVIFEMTIFIPSVLMLVASLIHKKSFCIAAPTIGILLWLQLMLRYTAQNGVEEVLHFDDCSVSIGTWIAAVLFAAAFVIAVTSKNGNRQAVSQTPAAFLPRPPAAGTTVEKQGMISRGAFCPNCGSQINAAALFCGKCGHKL